jgi:DNA-binding GntR family transcriptional regulator
MSSSEIADRIVAAILAQKLAPGARLGEQSLALLFDCSRTLVREALMQLAARGIVTVSSARLVRRPALRRSRARPSRRAASSRPA